jgi:hypothetical protein
MSVAVTAPSTPSIHGYRSTHLISTFRLGSLAAEFTGNIFLFLQAIFSCCFSATRIVASLRHMPVSADVSR